MGKLTGNEQKPVRRIQATMRQNIMARQTGNGEERMKKAAEQAHHLGDVVVRNS